jgi:hypothetical protein
MHSSRPQQTQVSRKGGFLVTADPVLQHATEDLEETIAQVGSIANSAAPRMGHPCPVRDHSPLILYHRCPQSWRLRRESWRKAERRAASRPRRALARLGVRLQRSACCLPRHGGPRLHPENTPPPNTGPNELPLQGSKRSSRAASASLVASSAPSAASLARAASGAGLRVEVAALAGFDSGPGSEGGSGSGGVPSPSGPSFSGASRPSRLAPPGFAAPARLGSASLVAGARPVCLLAGAW